MVACKACQSSLTDTSWIQCQYMAAAGALACRQRHLTRHTRCKQPWTPLLNQVHHVQHNPCMQAGLRTGAVTRFAPRKMACQVQTEDVAEPRHQELRYDKKASQRAAAQACITMAMHGMLHAHASICRRSASTTKLASVVVASSNLLPNNTETYPAAVHAPASLQASQVVQAPMQSSTPTHSCRVAAPHEPSPVIWLSKPAVPFPASASNHRPAHPPVICHPTTLPLNRTPHFANPPTQACSQISCTPCR
jgi:hypothetical protein